MPENEIIQPGDSPSKKKPELNVANLLMNKARGNYNAQIESLRTVII